MSESQAAKNRYDIVIFGASGFTGQYVVEETIKASETNIFTWAIAGRSESKLKDLLKNVYEVTGKTFKEVPVIIADISNEESLVEMCKQAQVVLNCVGPYRLYGEPVVKACIANKAHYIDISGEPLFLERMQLEYHEQAKEAGVYIIGSAGFDSIQIEAAIRFLQDKFPGDIAYVETYFVVREGEKGMSYNYANWQSAIYRFAHSKEISKELKPLREKLLPERLPKGKYKAPPRSPLFFSNDVNNWCLPFPGADKAVVNRTQYYLYFQRKVRPFHINTYYILSSQYSSLLSALKTMFVACIFVVFASFSFGRGLLEKYPKCFSFGMFSKEGPKREQIVDTTFTTTLVASGYKEKLAEPNDEHASPPEIKLVATVQGPEPAYVATPICMLNSGFIILQEKNKLPDKGGVYTPGAAFYDSTLVERLLKNGFEIVIEGPLDI